MLARHRIVPGLSIHDDVRVSTSGIKPYSLLTAPQSLFHIKAPVLLSTGSLPKWSQWLRIGQAQAKSWKLNPSFPHG